MPHLWGIILQLIRVASYRSLLLGLAVGVTPTPSSTPIHVESPVYPSYGGTATASGAAGGGGGGGPGPIRPRRWRRRRGCRSNNKQASKQQIVS